MVPIGAGSRSTAKTAPTSAEIASKSVEIIVIVISKLLKRYSKAKRTRHQIIHERCDESKGVFQRGVKRSSGPISRIPGGDRVGVKVGVVQMEKVNSINIS